VPSPDAFTRQEWLVPPTVLPEDADFDALGYPADSCVDLRLTRDDPDASGHVPAWMRVTAEVPDDPVTSASTLCYLSDITLGTTALGPHGGREATTHLQLGAMELALWFAKPVPHGDWVLFQLGTALSGGATGSRMQWPTTSRATW
jgi:acyl-CoA thioesterase